MPRVLLLKLTPIQSISLPAWKCGKASAFITMEYQGCAGLQDPLVKASCVVAAQQTLKSKIYVESEASCEKEELHGWRFLGGLSPIKRYFVVVANADAEKDHSYFFWFE